jgi:hypothetical protein
MDSNVKKRRNSACWSSYTFEFSAEFVGTIAEGSYKINKHTKSVGTPMQCKSQVAGQAPTLLNFERKLGTIAQSSYKINKSGGGVGTSAPEFLHI